MGKQNYKGEKYFDTSTKLLTDLDSICETLVKNLKTKGKSYTAEEIVNADSFNDLWQVTPNKHDNKHSTKEFKGVYAFATVDNNKIDFRYVGISQTIRRRFSGHTKRTTRNDATWAYLMIKREHPELKSTQEREKKIPEYQKKIILPLRFTFCPVDDNMLLHIAEVYCVNKLNAYWNSFETH